MSFASRWLLLGLLLLPAIVLGYVPLAAAAGPLRRPLHEPRRARERRREHPLLAAPRRPRALPARADGAARRLRAAEHGPPGRPRGGDDRARDRRLRLDAGRRRRADAARGSAGRRARLPQGPARALPGRRRRVLGDRRRSRRRRPTTAQLAVDAIDYLYPQRGTAIGDAARARGRGRPRRRRRDGPVANRPAAIVLLSDGSQTEGSCCRSRARRGRSRSRSPSTRSRSAPPRALSSSPASAARASSRCRPTGDAAPDRRARPAAASTRRRAPATCARRTSSWLAREQGEAQGGGHLRVPRRRARPAARRRRDLRHHVPEAAVRVALLAALAVLACRLQRRRRGGGAASPDAAPRPSP